LVCSPHELHVVDQVAPSLVKVTPGIRLAAVEDDQSRVATPAEAIARGATWLVIGRPIAHAADPVSAAKEVLDSMRGSERAS
jgi:orotidine-5'-phosphate decarboxylase